jgi:YVTN family beta-propeller protein
MRPMIVRWTAALALCASAGAASAQLGTATPAGSTATAAPLAVWQSPLAALPIVEKIRVPAGPAWLATGFGSVWVSKSESKQVLRIDPLSNRVIASIPVGSDPELGIGIGLGSVWVADTKDHSITQIDPRKNRVVRVIAADIAEDPEGSIGVGEGSLWFLTNGNGGDSGVLARLDPVSGKVVAHIPVRPKSHAVIVALGSVWVTSSGDGVVTRIDPSTNRVTAQIAVHPSPRFMAAGFGSIWVLTQGDGSLARIDARTNRVLATIDLGVPGEGGDLSIAEGFVWVSAEGVPLSQVDPQSNELVRQFVGGRKDDTLRIGFGAAWIVDEDNGEIWRVDLKKLAASPASQRR